MDICNLKFFYGCGSPGPPLYMERRKGKRGWGPITVSSIGPQILLSVSLRRSQPCLGSFCRQQSVCNKKLTRRWASVRELSLRRHRTRTTKYNRLVHKFRNRSTRLCVRTQVYQIQWNNAMQRPLHRSRSFKVTDFGTNRKLIYDFLLVINTNLTTILHRFQVMVDYWSNFRQQDESASL